MALMKYATFLQTVAFVGVPVIVTQKGNKGFFLSAEYQKQEGEELKTNIIEMAESADGETAKVFKSLASVEKALRKAELFEFSVILEGADIKRAKKKTTTKKTETTETPAEATA